MECGNFICSLTFSVGLFICGACNLETLTKNNKLFVFQIIEKDGAVVRALRSRRQVILDNIRDNDEAGAGYKKVSPGIFFSQYRFYELPR